MTRIMKYSDRVGALCRPTISLLHVRSGGRFIYTLLLLLLLF